MTLVLVLSVAAVVLAAAALVLSILVMRQSATALTAARRATTHGDRLTATEDGLADVQAYAAQLAAWADDAEHRLTGLVARVGLPGQPTPRPDTDPPIADQPATAHLERTDHPTTAMPTTHRPRPEPRP